MKDNDMSTIFNDKSPPDNHTDSDPDSNATTDSCTESTNGYVDQLIGALDKHGGYKLKLNPFFTSPVWCFLTFFSLLVNFILVAVIFWQRIRIDYLVTKIIGE